MGSADTIVISLGGSIVVPHDIDTDFLLRFRSLITEQTEKGKRFIIIVGGGHTARKYIDALEVAGEIDNIRKDWMGIYSTHLNAQFVKIFFKDLAYKELLLDKKNIPDTDKPVLFGAGGTPGSSTDLGAVAVAETSGATCVINLSNIAHVYDSDPNKNPNAVKYEKLSWDQYRSFIPSDWTPGLSTPFDPIASERASDAGLEVAIMNGKDLENLRRYFEGEDFEGTVIS